MQGEREQRAYKLQTILDFAERLFVLCRIDESASLRSSESEMGVIEELDNFREDLANLGLRDADVQSRDLLSGLLAQLRFSDESTVDGFLGDLLDRIEELRLTIQQEAEQRSLYFVIPGYRFVRFQSPEFMDPPIPLRVERFLDEAKQCWDVGFELAAVILTLVATEVLNRHHSATLLVGSTEQELRQTWGELVKLYPESTLKGHLSTVVQHRNEAMHGRLEVDERSAISIIEQCAHVSNQLLESLRQSDRVLCPPTPEEVERILMATSSVVGRARQETLVRILKGEANEQIVDQGWDTLPDFGILRDYSFPWIDDKVRWLFDNRYLRNNYEHGSSINYANDEIKKLAQSLWVTRLFLVFESCLRDDDPEQVWSWLSTLPRHVKKALLTAIAHEERADFAPILHVWFKQEGLKAVRQAINRTLQALGQLGLPHPQRKK